MTSNHPLDFLKSQNSFSPVGCEFSVVFPTAPKIEEIVGHSTGNHAIQAQTPGDDFPWILAQCTTGADGSAPPDTENRRQRVSSMLAARGSNDIRTSILRDSRGEWVSATGTIVVQGHPLTMTVTSVAGSSSMLLVTGWVRNSADNAKFERFLAGVTHNKRTNVP